ncbi:MAG: cyclic nucleotide-binding domain-containing protein [Acidobacteriota bacterium]
MSYTAQSFQEGEIIFRAGDDGAFMYLIQEGEVEIVQDLDTPNETKVAILQRGDFFGEMAMLDHADRSQAARARSDLRLVRVDRAGFVHMLRRNPDISVRMVSKLAERLAGLEEELAQALGHPSPPSVSLKPRSARFTFLGDGREFPLAEGVETTIGRLDPANDIHPDIDLTEIDPQISTSRRHARVIRKERRVMLMEEKATNGTFVNGKRIAGEPHELHGGDLVMFGAVRMNFLFD